MHSVFQPYSSAVTENNLLEIVDTAIRFTGARFGNIQLADPESGHLKIVAQRGFSPEWLQFWDSVSAGQGACGSAMQKGTRIIVEDVETSPIFMGTPALDIQRKAGVRAVQSTPIINRDGEFIGMFSTHYSHPHVPDPHTLQWLDQLAIHAADIISAMHTSQILQKKQQKLSFVVEQFLVGIAETDNHGNFRRVNDRFCSMTGYSRSELTSGMCMQQITLPCDLSDNLAKWQRLHDSGVPFDIEKRYRRKDGSILWVRNSVSLIRNASGESSGGIAVCIDISEQKQLEHSLRAHREWLEMAQTCAGVGAFDWNIKAGDIRWNPAIEALYGLRPGEFEGHIEAWLQRIHPEDRQAAMEACLSSVTGRNPFDHEFRVILPDGSIRWLHGRSTVLCDDTGQAERMLGVNVDISARKLQEADRLQAILATYETGQLKHLNGILRESEARFRLLLDSIADGVIGIAQDGKCLFINQAGLRILGYSSIKDIPHLDAHQLMHGGQCHDGSRQPADCSLCNILRSRPDGSAMDQWLVRADGTRLEIECRANPIENSGNTLGMMLSFSDVSKIRQAEQHMRRLAHHDSLTGMPNRLAFMTHLEKSIERCRRNGSKLGLMFLDLDRFKHINDTLGHAAGDHLLQAVSARLQATLRSGDMAARLGGDEFTVIIEALEHGEDLATLARKIIDAIHQPVTLHSQDIVTSASIGISIFPTDAETAEDLCRYADAAMYRAKNFGRNTYEFYTRELTQLAMMRMAMEQDLRRALSHGQFELFYQPQIDVASGAPLGVEALLRWHHPKLGTLLPSQFLDVAEECGLCRDIGDWVLREAVDQAADWHAEGVPPLRMGVNVSAHHLAASEIPEKLHDMLRQRDWTPAHGQIQIEITETALMQGKTSSLDVLHRLRDIGVSVAIDDFGTGYSSLSRLKHLPIDTLKVDGSFLERISEDAENRAIASAIVSLGHSLGLRVIVEGVETPSQLDFIRDHGGDEAQGFHIGHPLPASELRDWLRSSVVAPAQGHPAQGLGPG